MGALADDEAAVLAGAEAARRAYLDAVGRGLRTSIYGCAIAEAVLAAAEAKRRARGVGACEPGVPGGVGGGQVRRSFVSDAAGAGVDGGAGVAGVGCRDQWAASGGIGMSVSERIGVTFDTNGTRVHSARDLDPGEQPRADLGEVVYVRADDHRRAVEALREIKHVAAIEAPPVSDEVPAKVWKLAFDALNAIEAQS
jgi:hypothetical protein